MSQAADNGQDGKLSVAIVHYWFVSHRGGEKVVDALLELFPQADVFTHVIDEQKFSDLMARHRVRQTFIGALPGARRFYQKLLPLMPIALEQLDLQGYDLVLSSESGPSKGVLTNPDAFHLCYCHSPMRYLWDMYPEYRRRTTRLNRWMMPLLTHYLRQWDQQSANRVDAFIANSRYIARRIEKTYRREASVVHPPVDVERFDWQAERGDYFVMLGQLTAYKRPDVAVDAFRQMHDKRLLVIGEGEMKDSLEKQAADASNVVFLGHCSDEVVRETLERAKGLIFPGVEDFGIVPVEAQACGTPVIAYGRGGVLDSVIDEQTGLLVAKQTADAFQAALGERFERFESQLDRGVLRANAERFGKTRFQDNIATLIAERRHSGSTV